MCGLAGIIPAQRRRSQKELDQIKETFTRLLVLSEHRGPYATGAASVRADGDINVLKRPVRARDFVRLPAYQEWLETIGRDTTYLMGHTRWPTRGSVLNPDNNHPLVSDPRSEITVAVTHNGSLFEPDRHFRRLGLPRSAEVDSELLLRIAERHANALGLDIDGFLSDIEQLDGLMSAVLVVGSSPGEIILLKGNRPLEVRYHPELEMIAYASESEVLDSALTLDGWQEISLAHLEGLLIHAADDLLLERFKFRFGEPEWGHRSGRQSAV